MEPVRNSKNPLVVEAARLHRSRERKQTGTTMIEGPHLLEEAIQAGVDIRQLFALAVDTESRELARHLGIDPVLIDEPALKRLAGTETPRGPIAVVAIPEETDPTEQNLLVSWGVSDPGNVGTMIRTARAFGWGFCFAEGTADPWSPKVLRSAAGSQFGTGIHSVSELSQLVSSGYEPVSTVVRGGEDPSKLGDGRFALLIGEEAAGLPDDIVAACDRSVTIPMPGGAESLNAAVAAGIIVHEISRAAR
ncbi:MAG TPA: RNA methyltransferase [Acidimicrobiia bacterium]